MEYRSTVTIETDAENEPDAICNAYDCAEDNFEGRWNVVGVESKLDNQWIEACAESDRWHDLLTDADAHDRKTGAYDEPDDE
jgi:hypothetical protein